MRLTRQAIFGAMFAGIVGFIVGYGAGHMDAANAVQEAATFSTRLFIVVFGVLLIYNVLEIVG